MNNYQAKIFVILNRGRSIEKTKEKLQDLDFHDFIYGLGTGFYIPVSIDKKTFTGFLFC